MNNFAGGYAWLKFNKFALTIHNVSKIIEYRNLFSTQILMNETNDLQK